MSKPPFVLSIPYNPSKMKTPSAVPPFPVEFYQPVALLTLSWGPYENLIHVVLAAFLKVSEDPNYNEGWEIRPYKFKVKLLKRAFKRLLVDQAAALATLLRIVDHMNERSAKRNAIVHGEISCKSTYIGEGVVKTVLVSVVERRSGSIKHEFTPSEIEDMAYEVMHATGVLGYVTGLEESVAFPVPEESVVGKLRATINGPPADAE